MATVDIQKSSGPPQDPGGNLVGVNFDSTANQLRVNNAGTIYNFPAQSTGPAVVPTISTTAALGVPFFTEVTIPAASVLTLRATPYELVPAPGALRTLVLLGGIATLVFNSVAYTESTANLVVRYVNGSGTAASASIEATGLADAVASTSSTIAPANGVVASSVAVNGAFVLHNTGAGEWANSGNSTLRVKVLAMVVAST